MKMREAKEEEDYNDDMKMEVDVVRQEEDGKQRGMEKKNIKKLKKG